MIQRFETGKRMSRVVTHNGVAYLAGLTADDLAEDIAGQTRQVLAKTEARLASAGTDKSRLLSATIWLRHINDFDPMNRVWEEWIDPANPPTRATAECRLADDDILIEVIFTAAC
ncbi:RidA family protein (plasmid) [Agrobacterium fabrum]|uniref:RidA family protein n=1 Tax=Rhizobium/Agrobacterium group TaxID=227290 RepID=UPI0004D48C96|nr:MULTISPECIES: RidA family protein [Rhizobium/Agrobacterium group]KEA04428.1 cytochrome C2 [Rhizobium rhizogenes]NMV72547.1 RidA family protein [Agrobacterium fabrum]NTI85388.1 RidA family protein [Rhizobium rhizogenes]NTJ27571.1 RidA family protein [Rhizobium rhizogenes]QRM41759.1 RidA family protein [Rhizobium rhizogenes]